ncbi:MAG: transporter [Acidobacteria bacterium]|nr:transporter [Acidobacteriota bacterium]
MAKAESIKATRGGIRFDRNELAGAFGDIGTDLPLIVGVILAANLDSASALILFGAMQILTALRYRIPMPVQPLKAVAALVIAQKIGGDVLFGGGLAIGALMLLLTVTGLIDLLARVVPRAVVRGIQFGLGLQLATLALKDYVKGDGARGYVLAAIVFVLIVLLIGNRRYPAALFVIVLGLAYALIFKLNGATLIQGIGFRLPHVYRPHMQDVISGFILLALPQIPLSLGNSVLATRQISEDLFPEKRLTVRGISFTYSLMNLINPFFGGIPTCHGSGGMMGHYAFGGRTGGSVIYYGILYLILGLFFSGSFTQVVQVFPLPILGVLLAVEGLRIMLLVRDTADKRAEFSIAVLVGLIAASLPYGYLVGMLVGTALYYLARNRPFSQGV